MQHNYKLLRLTNNTTIVGDFVFSPESVLIAYPLEIYSKPISNSEGKVVGEQMVLRPLLIMTNDTDVVIDTYNILFINELDARLIPTYEEMVKNVYKNSVSYDGSAYVTKEEEDDYTEEEAEYLREALASILDNDKTYH